MFRLSPIKLWRNISIIMFLLAMVFCLIGTFTIHGVLIIHWNDAGVPNNSSGKWVLWAMLLLAFLSMFTHSSFSKKRPGQNSLSIEVSGAFSTGLVSTWSIINITLVTYYFYPLTDIVIIGTAAIAFCYILFPVIAYIRNRKRNPDRNRR